MAFSLKTWVNRISEYPNRRKLTHEDGNTELVTVARAEGQISAEGNAFSAEEMNDLENRIKGGFDEVNQSLDNIKDNLKNEILYSGQVGNVNGISTSNYFSKYKTIQIYLSTKDNVILTEISMDQIIFSSRATLRCNYFDGYNIYYIDIQYENDHMFSITSNNNALNNSLLFGIIGSN